MNRWGYAVLAILVVALAGYLVLTPEAAKDRFSQVWQGERPSQFTLTSPGLTQEVAGAVVQLKGRQRPVDEAKLSRMWQVLSSMRADRYTAVNPADLAAYGIGEWAIKAEGVDIRWGQGDGQSYVYIGSRGEVAIMNDGVFPSLVRVATRMDQHQLLDPSLRLQRFSYADEVFLPDARGEWFRNGQADRPPLSPAFKPSPISSPRLVLLTLTLMRQMPKK